MLPKTFIINLTAQNSTYHYASQAENLANSLNTISNDIYSESKRFIYELIQNADDASAATGGAIIHIEFADSYLIVSHTGRAFSQTDIEAICSIGKSQKTASICQTGYKGIGFKSVFGQSDWVYIRSNYFRLRFDREYWQSQQSYSLPWQIIPIWTEDADLPEVVKAKLRPEEFSVMTVLRHPSIGELEHDILELLNETQLILFLRNIQTIVIKAETELTIERTQNPQSRTITLKRNGVVESEWLTKDIELEIDAETRAFMQHDKLPKKLREATYTRLSFAGKVEDGNLVELNDSYLFAYLPTQVSLELPVLVNGDFVTNASREQLHSDLHWNQWLLNQTAVKLLEWVAELAQNRRYRLQVTQFLPHRLREYGDIEEAFNEGLEAALETIPFVPNDVGELSTIQTTVLDKTGIYEVLGRSVLIGYVNEKLRFNKTLKQAVVDPSLQLTKKLESLDIEIFEPDKLEKLLTNVKTQSGIDSKISWALIDFFYRKCSKSKTRDIWHSRLKSVPFILNQAGQPTAPNQPLYFPPQHFSEVFDSITQHFNFIQDNLLQYIQTRPEIQRWLREDLRLSEPTPGSIVQDIILPRIQQLTQTPEQSLETIRYLFSVSQRDRLSEEQFKQLTSAQLITTVGELVPADQCYLADRYQPEIQLESHQAPCGEKYGKKLRVFVSEKYLTNDSLVKEWNLFFTKIGVHEKPGLICNLQRQSYAELKQRYPEYVNYVFERYISSTQYAPYQHQHFIQNFVEAAFHSLICTDPNYSKLFWNYIISNSGSLKPISTQYLVWNGNRVFEVLSHFKYMIYNEPCFPTTTGRCCRASEVILNLQEFHELAGDCLPILDLDAEVPVSLARSWGIRIEMTAADYLDVLSYLSSQPCDANITKLQFRVSRIYKALSRFTDVESLTQIRNWAGRHTILAIDGNFYGPSMLYYINVDQFDAGSERDRFVAVSQPDDGALAVLKLMGVQVIESEQLSLNVNENPVPAIELKTQLASCLPLIALVIASIQNKDWHKTLQTLTERLDQIELYQAIQLSIEFTKANRLLLSQPRKTWTTANQLYFVGDWRSARILYALTTALCAFLDISNVERELSVLLLEPLQSGLEWLEESKYDTSLIRPFMESSRGQIDAVTGNTHDSTASIPAPVEKWESKDRERTDEQRQRDAETGRRGELFVFEELQRYFSQQYQMMGAKFELTQTGFRIGATEVIWENLQVHSIEPYRYNIVESGKAYDFQLIHQGTITFIDAKSTTLPEGQTENCFYLSPNEWMLMRNQTHSYYVARVFNAQSSPVMRLIKLEVTNPEMLTTNKY